MITSQQAQLISKFKSYRYSQNQNFLSLPKQYKY